MPDLKLTALLKPDNADDIRWFHYRESPDGLFEITKDESKAHFSLQAIYRSKRSIRKLLEGALVRKPASKAGAKGLYSSESEQREILCSNVVRGWKMTVNAAKRLLLEAEFKDTPGTDEIPYTPDNLKAMVKRSLLPAVVANLVANHEAWFGKGPDEEDDDTGGDGDDEGDEGNSEGGPNSSSATPPAGIA